MKTTTLVNYLEYIWAEEILEVSYKVLVIPSKMFLVVF